MKRGESREKEKPAPTPLSLRCRAHRTPASSFSSPGPHFFTGSPSPQAVCPLGPGPDAYCRGTAIVPITSGCLWL